MTRERAGVAGLAAFALAWFAFLAWSALLTRHPVVLSDEAAYLLPSLFGYRPENYARWGIIAQIPDVLFYRVYGAFSGTDIYAAAKLLNSAFIVLAAVPAYLIARQWLRPFHAALFAALVITDPLCTFARYFMPEALYYLLFWWTVYAFLAILRSGRAYVALVVAATLLAVLSLVKPHALGLVLAICLFLVLRPGTWTAKLLQVLLLSSAWYAVRVELGYLVSRQWDWSLTGPAYRGILAPLQLDLPSIATIGIGHIAALALLAGSMLAALCVAAARSTRDDRPATRDLVLLTLCVLAALVAMTLYFSYSVHFLGGVERVSRLHGRYYSFVLPLVVLAFVAIERERKTPPGSARLLLFVAMVLIGWYVVGTFYETSVVDYPDLGILPRWPNGLVVPAAAGGLCLVTAVWLRGRAAEARTAIPLVWWSTISVLTTVGLLVAPQLGKFFVPDDIDRIMLESPLVRTLHGRSDGAVIGTTDVPVDTFKVMFHLASLSRGRLAAPGSILAVDSLPTDANWLLLLPGIHYAGPGVSTQLGPLTYVRIR